MPPKGSGLQAYNKALRDRAAKSLEFDDLKTRNEQQKKRLGRFVDFLNETNQLDAFVKWDEAQGVEPE